MKTHFSLTRTLCLMIVLVFAIVSIASAGAVLKRDNNNRDKDDKPAVTERSKTKGDSRSSDRSRSTPSNNERDNSRVQRPTPREGSDRSGARTNDTIRRPDPIGPTVRNQNDQQDRTTTRPRSNQPNRPGSVRTPNTNRDPNRTMVDRQINSTPGVRPGRVQSQSPPTKVDTRSSVYRIQQTRNDRVYTRPMERPVYVKQSVYRAPVYRSGYYHYYDGWAPYYDYPLRYGYWYFDYYTGAVRSAYHYYEYFPYVASTTIIVHRRPTMLTYVEIPIVIRQTSTYYGSGYYLEDAAFNAAGIVLSNLKRSWLDNYPELLLQYVRKGSRIDVLLDGAYSYSVNGEDYINMTEDAIMATETISFDILSVRRRGSDRVVAYAKHRFYNPYGEKKTVYVSYVFEQRNGRWNIVEVGSSPKRFWK